jgi:hypothetical protein
LGEDYFNWKMFDVVGELPVACLYIAGLNKLHNVVLAFQINFKRLAL